MTRETIEPNTRKPLKWNSEAQIKNNCLVYKMDYASRLSDFNRAVTDTSDHVKRIRDTLTSPEMVANPVKGALETAGQVSGTAGGILGIKKAMEDKSMMRRGITKIYNRLGGNRTTGTSTTSTKSDGTGTGGNSGRTDGAANSDGAPTDGNTGTRSGDTAARPAVDDAAAPGGGAGEGTAAPAAAAEDNPFSLRSYDPVEFTRQTRGAQAVDAENPFGDTGRSLGRSLTTRTPNPAAGSGGSDASAVRTTAGTAEDISSAANQGTSLAEQGQNALAAGRSVISGLSGQSTPGTVAGIANAGTADSPAGAAHVASQAQTGNAIEHQRAQAPGNQAESGDLSAQQVNQAKQSGAAADSAATGNPGGGGAVNGSSSAAKTGDETGNGISKALTGEETADEVLGDVPVIGTLLEGFSLLATLGTSIAGAFESNDKKTTPKVPPGGMPQTLSVGANLKQDHQQAVGAF